MTLHIFQKVCNEQRLKAELLMAGFAVVSIQVDFPAGQTIILLDDEGVRQDPAPVVSAHVYVEEPVIYDFRSEYRAMKETFRGFRDEFQASKDEFQAAKDRYQAATSNAQLIAAEQDEIVAIKKMTVSTEKCFDAMLDLVKSIGKQLGDDE